MPGALNFTPEVSTGHEGGKVDDQAHLRERRTAPAPSTSRCRASTRTIALTVLDMLAGYRGAGFGARAQERGALVCPEERGMGAQNCS